MEMIFIKGLLYFLDSAFMPQLETASVPVADQDFSPVLILTAEWPLQRFIVHSISQEWPGLVSEVSHASRSNNHCSATKPSVSLQSAVLLVLTGWVIKGGGFLIWSFAVVIKMKQFKFFRCCFQDAFVSWHSFCFNHLFEFRAAPDNIRATWTYPV